MSASLEVLDRIVDELSLRPLLVVGSSRAGKTIMVKSLIKRLKDRGVRQITIFDPSLAWWNNAPLKYRKTCRPHINTDWRTDHHDCVCDVSKFIGDERGGIISDIVEYEYEGRVNQRRVSGCSPTSFPLDVTVLEEAQTLFKKFGMPGTRIYDWVSMGLNFNMTGIYTTQRPAEVPTEIIERCNLLVGYVDGHRNMQKLRGATNKEFMESVKRTKQGSYEFVYYDGGRGFGVKTEDVVYGQPFGVDAVKALPLPTQSIGVNPKSVGSKTPSWWWIPPVLIFLALIEYIW